MPPVVRLGDICTGHGSFPPRPNTQGSPNVYTNGLPTHRVGDSWAVHCDDVPTCHGGSQASGSGTVFVNGKPISRVGDAVNCGSKTAQGSENVMAGD